MLSLTPVLFVEEIEPCLDFWKYLGFEQTMAVQDETSGKAAFVALQRNDVVIMYQTIAGLRDDMPALAEGPMSTSGMSLYLKVKDLDDVNRRIQGAVIVVPERTTFYGAREIVVRAPCGTIVAFAEFADQEAG